MFCNQCEQTARGIACSAAGVCGKKPEIADLLDELTSDLRRLAFYAAPARKAGWEDHETDALLMEALFATLTNVNFDAAAINNIRDRVNAKANQVLADLPADSPRWTGTAGIEYLVSDPDLNSLQQLLLYGLRGISAYAHHAVVLGQEDRMIYDFIIEGLAALGTDKTMEELLTLVMKCGEVNYRAMELLDAANTGLFGHPVPTSVPLGHRAGKCILVSGHDLKDLLNLLKQTEGTGVNVYTHGEMLPAHGYPELNKYSHLAGHYGTAWHNQKKEFAAFPGAILMTTNCIQEPQVSYKSNIFTTGPVGWPGVEHVKNGEFASVIARAKELPGFDAESEAGSVTTGFARQAVLSVADRIVEGVKSGAIRHFFLVAGCDGAKAGRNYYSELVEKTPGDTVVMTLACGKFRFFDKQLGDIGGIPRLLDIGQCNDAYSAIQIALALANAFDCGVNDLPLSMILSWYEQKAVSILLTLLYLGIKDIRLGPSLPAFITPNILQFLVDNFGIKSITTPDQDLAAILG
ncbi:MAG: hydroxylamine reductase [Methylocystaceae bacterium]